jgi:oxygen-independent coproporphyrinogen-3 oxidase
LNFDLMYGLPGQSLEDLEDTLASTLEMRPERISLFGYAHVPSLIPRQRRIDASALPGVRERFDQAAFGYGRICEDGYQPVGFDHFALPSDALAAAAREGRLRRNFQGFTEDDSDRLIGLGASAISGFPEALVQNEKNAGRYRMLLSAGRLPAARGVLRNGEDRHRARIIEQILCRGEASLEGIALSGLLPRLQPFQERELVHLAGSVLRLAPEAIPYARAIVSLFDIHRGEQSPRFSNAV